jgi:hypothetical protein
MGLPPPPPPPPKKSWKNRRCTRVLWLPFILCHIFWTNYFSQLFPAIYTFVLLFYSFVDFWGIVCHSQTSLKILNSTFFFLFKFFFTFFFFTFFNKIFFYTLYFILTFSYTGTCRPSVFFLLQQPYSRAKGAGRPSFCKNLLYFHTTWYLMQSGLVNCRAQFQNWGWTPFPYDFPWKKLYSVWWWPFGLLIKKISEDLSQLFVYSHWMFSKFYETFCSIK